MEAGGRTKNDLLMHEFMRERTNMSQPTCIFKITLYAAARCYRPDWLPRGAPGAA